MSEKPSSEYHKKTCIICGCHTNQTINIYEPRSGPNIVRLIQARFKFQPLNEDKYLCYSCNNWLINWHSLQALNSNDSDNPSGTFRSPQMNSMVTKKGSPSSKANNMSDVSTKPVAQVRPQLKNQPDSNMISHLLPKKNTQTTRKPSTKRCEYYYLSKRTILRAKRIKKTLQKTRTLHNCCVCGRTIKRKILTTSSKAKTLGMKCRKCRDTIHWRNMYLKTVILEKKQKQQQQQQQQTPNETKASLMSQSHASLVNSNSQSSIHNKNCSTSQISYQPRQYQRPLIDGKVVSMLRRLGTTLSRDGISSSTNNNQPPIMSPAKKKPQKWTRNIDDNEIVINFNTAITEVLPIRNIRRRLTYQISDAVPTLNTIEIDSSSDEEENANDDTNNGGNIYRKKKNQRIQEANKIEKKNCGINLEQVYSLLPKGLTVSLIPDGTKSILVN